MELPPACEGNCRNTKSTSLNVVDGRWFEMEISLDWRKGTVMTPSFLPTMTFWTRRWRSERVRVVVIHNFNWPIGAEGIASIRAAIEQAELGTPIFLNL